MNNWDWMRKNKRKLTPEQKHRMKNRKKEQRLVLEEGIHELKQELRYAKEEEIEKGHALRGD